MLRLTFCFFNCLLEQQVVLKDRDTISDSEEASKGFETLNDRIASFILLLVFSRVPRVLQVLDTQLVGQRQNLRVEPMNVPDVEWEMNRRVLVKRLFHVRLSAVVHGEAHRLSSYAFVGGLRNVVTSVPNVQSDHVD